MIAKVFQLYGKNWPSNEPSELTMIKTLSTLYKKYRGLVLKKDQTQIKKFENCTFRILIPLLDTCSSDGNSHRQMEHNSKRKSLIRGEYLQSLKRTISNLCCELKGIRDEAVISREHCGSLQRTGNMRNIRRSENRKQKRLALQEETINQLSSENKQLRIAVQKVEKNFQESKKKSALKIARIRKRFSKKKKQYKAQIRRLLRAKHAVYSSNSSDYFSDEENHAATIATLDRGHYNSKVLECCMQLLAHNVGIHNVRACIKAVCDLVGCELDHLPSKSTLANMMVEARAISHLQLADSVPAFNATFRRDH